MHAEDFLGGDATSLACVRIPKSLRAFESEAQTFDVEISGGVIAHIEASDAPSTGTLISCPVDAHVHLDKNFVVNQVGAAQGDLMRAISLMAHERERWSEGDIFSRMMQGVAEAHASGTRAMCTHLDWVTSQRPKAADAFEGVQREWAGRMQLACASLTPLDFFENAAAGESLAREVAELGGILGAFVYKNEKLHAKLERVFALATEYDLALDFHVDEGLAPEACGLRAIAQMLIDTGFQGRVTCGHACSLSVQPLADAMDTLRLCFEAGLHLVALPTTNAYLQGSWANTPVERGVTRLNEAYAQHIRPCIATDNVADAFFPYGSYDLLDTYAFGVQLAHLHPADEWLAAITVNPAIAMGLAWDGRIKMGCPADLVLLAARTGYDVVSPQGRQRRIWRGGRALASI